MTVVFLMLDKLDDKKMLPITLDAVEIIYLTDSVGNFDLDQGDVDQPQRIQTLARPLLLKLGGAYLELVPESGILDKNKTVVIYLTEREAWLLRGKIQTGTTGTDKSIIGLGLLRKLYGILLEFNSGVDVDVVQNDDVSFGDKHKNALNKLEKEEKAREGFFLD